MKRLLEKISDNEEELMTGLLNENFDFDIENFEVVQFNFNHAKVKILCCGLLTQSPKNIFTEEKLDFRVLFAKDGSSAFSYIYPGLPREYLSMPGNRILNPKGSSKYFLTQACEKAQEETLLSHLIDNEAVDYFLHGESVEFIKHRSRLMNETTREFLHRKCQTLDD